MRTVSAPLVPYQGSKRQIAPAILDILKPAPDEPFWDLCAGGGAVALEAVRRGHSPAQVTLVDHGPWGEVWRDVGAGTFNLPALRRLAEAVPQDPAQAYAHITELAQQPVSDAERPAVFLLLQSASFGGRAVGRSPTGWVHGSWRKLWMPTPTSTRRSRNLPLVPSPNVLYTRMANLCERLLGVRGIHGDVRGVFPTAGVAYLDPPYAGTKGYPQGGFEALAYAASLAVPCWISERRPLTEHAILLPSRTPHGLRNGHRADRSEWLSKVVPHERRSP